MYILWHNVIPALLMLGGIIHEAPSYSTVSVFKQSILPKLLHL